MPVVLMKYDPSVVFGGGTDCQSSWEPDGAMPEGSLECMEQQNDQAYEWVWSSFDVIQTTSTLNEERTSLMAYPR